MAVQTQPRPVAVPQQAQARRPWTFYLDRFIRYVLLTFFGLIFFAPFLLAFFGTFKTPAEIVAFPPRILPTEWRLENWVNTWNAQIPGAQNAWPAWMNPILPAFLEGKLFPRWLFNSLWLALLNCATQLFFCSLAGYAFARMRFPGKDLIFSFMIATMAIPGVITLIPGFVFFAQLGWINTYWPLIVPALVAPFGIFLMTQFLKSIPKELEEAAFIDGAGRFRTFWQIALPLSRPALITLAILQFQSSWNNFVGPLLYLRNPNLMTLTVGLQYFKTQFRVEWDKILIGSMFNAIPILIIFFIFNRYYIEGASQSGLAGQ